jgi:hypothetical protein
MAQQLRERLDKWNYMKLKSFCPTKEMVTKLKRLPTEWEKSLPHSLLHQMSLLSAFLVLYSSGKSSFLDL